jgi:hypothetical protein
MGDWHRRETADVVRELRTDPGAGLNYLVGLARGRSRE